MIKGICFDLDQTLCNSEDFILSLKSPKCTIKDNETAEYKVFEYLQEFLKIVTWEQFYEVYAQSKSELKKDLGHTASSHNRYLYLQRTLENLGARFNPSVVYDATDLYWDYVINQMTLFPNVRDVLKNLKRLHYKICIISDLTADIQIRKLVKLKISQYLDYLITSEETGTDKPLPDQLKLALGKLKLTKDEVIIVGNSLKTDIELGKREKVKTVLFDYYRDHVKEKNQADFYISDFKKLEGIIDIPDPGYSNEKMVIFDLIGTISSTSHLVSVVLRDLLKKSPEEIRPVYERYKIGEIKCEEFWRMMGIVDYKELELALIQKIKPRRSMFGVLESLSQKYRLIILSNMPKEWGRAVVKKYGLQKYFEKFYFSGDLKLKKPDPEIYKRVISDYKNINPENIYFVDDELDDLSSGKNLLMQTIWFMQETQEITYIPDYVIRNENELLEIL